MSIERKIAGDVTILRIHGDLSAANADQLRAVGKECIRDGQRDFVINLEEAQTCDSRGLEALTWLLSEAEDRLGLVRLLGANDTVKKILEITRLSHRFTAHDDSF